MGTLLNRRRVMVGVGSVSPYDENSYIQDGLVFQLDGINKGSNQGYWTDLVGGIVYTNYGAVSNKNCFSFDGSTYLLHDDTLSFDDTKTLEIVYNKTTSGNQCLFNTAGVNTSSFAFTISSNVAAHSHRNTYRHDVPSTGKMTFSVTNVTTCYQNYNLVANTNRSNWNNPDGKSYIGRRSEYNGNSNFFHGDIYAIRIYNKVLTEEEILHNQLVDNSRFKLGL